jgi:FkbM family methyltransferase
MIDGHGPEWGPGIATADWYTPAGNPVRLTYRKDTTDWNTVSACLANPYGTDGDEYHLPRGLSGWALDLGAHIGSVAVGLLADNPDLRVLAIEAVPENAELVRQNLELNGLTDRAIVWNAAGWSKSGDIQVEYDYSGDDTAFNHRYIGSVSPWIADAPRRYETIKSVTLRDALKVTDGAGFVWVKTDCEGCEHPFFQGAGLKKLGIIEGEWHHRDGTPESFAERLSKTHVVTWGEGIGGGPFKAVPR